MVREVVERVSSPDLGGGLSDLSLAPVEKTVEGGGREPLRLPSLSASTGTTSALASGLTVQEVEEQVQDVRVGDLLVQLGSDGVAVELDLKLQNDLSSWAIKAEVSLEYQADGHVGTKALEQFQRWFKAEYPEHRWASADDGIWGPRTMRAMDMVLGRDEKLLSRGEFATAVSKTYRGAFQGDAAQVTKLKALGRYPDLDGDFMSQVDSLSRALSVGDSEVKPEWILAVMDFESGLDPAARNSISNASGLIQFMPSTLDSDFRNHPVFMKDGEPLRNMNGKLLSGEDMAERVRSLSREEQMPLVADYFLSKANGREIGSVDQLYMLVLYPVAAGLEKHEVVFQQGTKAYQWNSGLDSNEDDRITMAEISEVAKLRERMKKFPT